MKKAIIVAMLLLLVSMAFAQESGDAPQRTKLFGINPLGLLINIYSGQVGMIINDGANEINIPFFYWHPIDEFTALGLGARYRFYKDKNGKRFFYGPTLAVSSRSWDYSTTETVTGLSFTPGGEIGYRWAWDNGFTLAPTINAGFKIGSMKASDGTEVSYGGSGISWGLGLGLAYMW